MPALQESPPIKRRITPFPRSIPKYEVFFLPKQEALFSAEYVSSYQEPNIFIPQSKKEKFFSKGNKIKKIFQRKKRVDVPSSEPIAPKQEVLFSREYVALCQNPSIDVEPAAKGTRLSDEIAQGFIPLDRLIRTVDRVSQGLQFAHNIGIIHTDITPSTIQTTITVAGDEDFLYPKLCDFSKSQSKKEPYPTEFWGTPGYIAPERLQWGAAEPEGDQYSLAVTVIKAITRNSPNDVDPLDLLQKHIDEVAPPVRKKVLEALQPVLQKALSPRPGMRYQRISQFSESLIEAYHASLIEEKKPNEVFQALSLEEQVVYISNWKQRQPEKILDPREKKRDRWRIATAAVAAGAVLVMSGFNAKAIKDEISSGISPQGSVTLLHTETTKAKVSPHRFRVPLAPGQSGGNVVSRHEVPVHPMGESSTSHHIIEEPLPTKTSDPFLLPKVFKTPEPSTPTPSVLPRPSEPPRISDPTTTAPEDDPLPSPSIDSSETSPDSQASLSADPTASSSVSPQG